MATIPKSELKTGVTLALVDRALDTRFDDLPAEIVEVARQCLLDWIGVTLAGASEPLMGPLLEEVAEQGGNPQASLIGRGLKVSMQQAALVNGAASHALDYDDVHAAHTGHPSVAIIPALLALAEDRGSSGAEFIEAFTAGYETICRMGRLVNPDHYERGFHATATLGAFGAAAACARLLGLDEQRTGYAFGIAATQAAGLKSMFGTMCKPLHAGLAARNGLLAASLAARGFDSRADVIECPQGFAATQSSDFNVEAALADPPGGYHMRANLFKYHAACYLTHAAIECAGRIREQDGFSPDTVREVIVRVNPGCDTVCNIPEPETGLESKFSLRMTTAFALAGIDTAAIANYSEAHCADPKLVALRDKTTVEFDASIGRMATEMHVTLDNELGFAETHDASVPCTDVGEQGRRLEAKFHSLVDGLVGEDASNDIVAVVGGLEGLEDIGAIIQACAAKSR